ncbi:HNH endonuclease [Archangium violaceum]|uniref:HNH endonuclease n=1 Tax=Archangium violaceum TaxID=83451 RepID=UPI002B2DBF92|nr:HNH endonuclease [Archangium gephyra]
MSEGSRSGQGTPTGLARAVREARYEEAQRALAEVAEREQDDVSREVVAALPEELLKRMAQNREGNLLLESLFDAMTSGHVTAEEMEQAARLLAAEAQRRHSTPEEFVRAVERVRVFPYEAMGLTKGGAPLTAGKREDGRIWVELTPRSFEDKYRAEAATLYGLEYVLEPDELVGVRLYDEGGGVVYVPALYLLLLSREDSARVGWKMVEAGALGLSLGASALVEAGVDAGVAARVLGACDRVAVAMGLATSLLLEHRGWLVERFGAEGRGFVYGLEVFHSALAVYGGIRLGMAAPSLVRGLRELYQGFLERAQAQSRLGRLMQEEAARVARLQQQMEELFQELDAIRKAGGATPQAGMGAKVIPLESARRGSKAHSAGGGARTAEDEVPLAATGTDARLLPIERQGGMRGAAPVASLRRGTGGARSPSATSAPRQYRLDTVEAWRKPHLTEDGKVLPFKGSRHPPEPIVILGRNRAGMVIRDGRNTMRFDKNGFADFDTEFEMVLESSHVGSARPDLHFKAANKRLYETIQADSDLARRLGLTSDEVARLPHAAEAPEGYVWHHHQDVGRMQLVRREAHRLANPHTGGMAIWGGGHPRSVRKGAR